MLIAVKDEALKENGVVFTRKTLYKFHSQMRYPELFVKLGGELCFDLDAYKKLIKEAVAKRQKKAEKIRRLKECISENRKGE